MPLPPNILYLHSHDTGRAIEPYGRPAPTPHLQRLAEQGVLFHQAFCAAPTCSPSRASLLTGQWAHRTGMLGLARRGFRISDYRRHLSHVLRSAGYATALAGVQHEISKPLSDLGYDRLLNLDANDKRVGDTTEAARAFLSSKPVQPFFLAVGYAETHRPFERAGPNDDPRYLASPEGLPDTPITRADWADYLASARKLDAQMGSVLASLEANGLSQNTLVVCTTDHGLPFPGHKCTLTDRGLGVMLIMRGPGGFTGGKVCDALVSHVDIFPTLCQVAGIAAPDWLDGRSMLPLVSGVTGEAAEIRDELFGEVTFHAAYEPMRAVRTKRWKYIRRFGGRRTAVLSNIDPSPSKSQWVAQGWAARPLAAEELYDLTFDPCERDNLADAPYAGTALLDMRARLDRWMKETDDPLLSGPVPPPLGTRITDADELEPTGRTLPVPAT